MEPKRKPNRFMGNPSLYTFLNKRVQQNHKIFAGMTFAIIGNHQDEQHLIEILQANGKIHCILYIY